MRLEVLVKEGVDLCPVDMAGMQLEVIFSSFKLDWSTGVMGTLLAFAIE